MICPSSGHRNKVNESLLELVNKSLIMFPMTSASLPAGRRAAEIVPALRGQTIALAHPSAGDDSKLFWMTFSGGLVVALTFLS